MIDNSPNMNPRGRQPENVIQRAAREEEKTMGLPATLRAGTERLSGMALDSVRVHYNSDKPDQVEAFAYTRGTEIYVAPGQERHLPHEAWHVVQQAQGRVQPTTQMKDGVQVSDDWGLEQEADAMGERAVQMKGEMHDAKPYTAAVPGHNTAVMRAPKKTKAGSEEQRPAGMKNEVWKGEDEADPFSLPGYKEIKDPFDHTVTVVLPDGTGTQYTYTVVEIINGDTVLRLTHTEELSEMRVKALAFMDEKQGTIQESETQTLKRIEDDRTATETKRQKWADQSPANQAALNDYVKALNQHAEDLEAYKDSLPKGKGQKPATKPPKPPAPPKGLPEPKRTTACNAFPPLMAAVISKDPVRGRLSNFDPEDEGTKRGSWRTLKTQPSGPKPGDVYSLGMPKDKKTIMHLGIFKSSRPGPNDFQTWTVVDGGQGSYESQQKVLERTRYYNPKTEILSTNLADAGQDKEDRSLRGWIDIDEHFKKKPDAAKSGVTSD